MMRMEAGSASGIRSQPFRVGTPVNSWRACHAKRMGKSKTKVSFSGKCLGNHQFRHVIETRSYPTFPPVPPADGPQVHWNHIIRYASRASWGSHLKS